MKNFTLLFLLLLTLPAYAQEQGLLKLSVSANRASFGAKRYTDDAGAAYTLPGRTVQGYGLNLEYFVGDYVSLAWSVEFGNTSQGANYMRYPAGIQMLPYLINNLNATSDWSYTALLLAILPEGVYWHLPIKEGKMYITPYISPFNIFREKKANLPPTPALGLSTGCRAELYAQKFTFAPYFGARTNYSVKSGGWGFEAGLHVGLLIND